MILEKLQADARFILIGSRRFGANTPDSDWDFSAQYSEELMEYLKGLGLKEVELYKYDNQCIRVMSYHGSEKIHVILHKNEALVRAVWNNMSAVFYKNVINKRSDDNKYLSRSAYNEKVTALFNGLYEDYRDIF